MAKPPDVLLAKSPRPGRAPVTLKQHLLDTEVAASHIFCLDKRWGQNWCRFFQLQGSEAKEQFLLNLRVAALFHDMGKANEDFYAAVLPETGFILQTIRHEHLSALILCLPEVRHWLSQNSMLDVDVITSAVLSHHLKADRKDKALKNGKSYKWCQPQAGSLQKFVDLYFQHSEITQTLEQIRTLTTLEGTVPVLPEVRWESGSIWDKTYQNGVDFADDFDDDLEENEERRSLLLAVKAGLIVSDAAASGLVREGLEISDWIKEIVHSKAIAHNEIDTKILQPRIRQIEERTKKSFHFHEFQKQAAEQGNKALLLVACGGGKTLAAWKWAEQQVKDYNVGKVIFLYPTRGTATEGFRDYVGWAPEADASLVTGTAKYELEAMATNPGEERGANSNSAIANKNFRTEADDRLYALGFWSKRFFSATVDQFLSFMEHRYQSLCLLPVLADSAVIIDEVHSFDRSMFDTLISFLRTFKVPVLCMTATLPPSRREELVNAGLKIFPTESDRASEELADLKALEQAKRYQLDPVANFSEAFEKAIAAYQSDDALRILWVVNTVDRCLAIASKLSDELKTDVLTYHSRFRLRDRQNVHANTVEAFSFSEGKEVQRAIAVTTQVCEMSLDLDADVLITEIAPVSSLVQRFGRANRHLKREFATLHPYKPPGDKPYDKGALEKAKDFLASFQANRVSQLQLTTELEHYSKREREADDELSSFLTGGYYAVPGSFRDTDDFSVPCILDTDLDEVECLISDRKPYDGFIVNVPQKWARAWLADDNTPPTWLPKYLHVVSGDPERYQSNRGFITKSIEEVDLG